MRQKNDLYREYKKIRKELLCAQSEFDLAETELEIETAIFRLNELEARQRILIERLKSL